MKAVLLVRYLSVGVRSGGGWLDAFDGADPIDGVGERGDAIDAGALGGGNEVRLGEVDAVELVDLHRAQQQRRIDGDHGAERDERPHRCGDLVAGSLVERLQDVDGLGADINAPSECPSRWDLGATD